MTEPNRPVPDLEAAFADHDRLFKELLTVFFADFLRLFAPTLAAHIDLESVTFLNQEIITDVTDGSRRVVDLLARVRMLGGEDQEAFILIHVENQSKPQARFARRMFLLTARLDEKYDLPIFSIAVFSYDAPRRKEPDQYRITFPGDVVLRYKYRSIQLNRLNWRTFLRQQNPVAAALMAKMKIAAKDRPRVKLECLRMIATLRLDPARTQLLSGFVDSYLRLDAQETETLNRYVAALPQEEREVAMPLTISWKEEGRVEGRVEEARKMLVLAGRSRLGAPSNKIIEQIEAMGTVEQLESLVQEIFRVETWDELFRS